MIQKMKTHLADVVRPVTKHAKTVAGMAGTGLRNLWRHHREQLSTDRDYAPAIGAAAAAVAALFTSDPAVLAVVAAATALYIAIHHATRQSPPDDSTGLYGRPGASWRPPTHRWDDDLGWDDESC